MDYVAPETQSDLADSHWRGCARLFSRAVQDPDSPANNAPADPPTLGFFLAGQFARHCLAILRQPILVQQKESPHFLKIG